MTLVFTHTGFLCGGPTGKARYRVPLRETKRFWITWKGTKYRKSDGWPAAEPWPLYSLELSTINPNRSSEG